MSRAPLEHGLYREALLNFKAAILLDNAEEKQSLEDTDWVLAKVRGVFQKTLAAGRPHHQTYRLKRAQSFMHVPINSQ
jgi:hypothetical protein